MPPTGPRKTATDCAVEPRPALLIARHEHGRTRPDSSSALVMRRSRNHACRQPCSQASDWRRPPANPYGRIHARKPPARAAPTPCEHLARTL